MFEELIEKCEKSMAKCFDHVSAHPDSQKGLHYSQAALNLTHARVNLEAMKSGTAPKASSAKKTD